MKSILPVHELFINFVEDHIFSEENADDAKYSGNVKFGILIEGTVVNEPTVGNSLLGLFCIFDPEIFEQEKEIADLLFAIDLG